MAQEDANNRHQCQSDQQTNKGDGHLLPQKAHCRKEKKPLIPTEPPLRLRKVVPGTSFQPSKNSHTQRTESTQSKKRNTLIPKKAQHVQPNQPLIKLFTSKEPRLGLTDSLPSKPPFATSACPFRLSHQNPLLCYHSPSTVRERLFLL